MILNVIIYENGQIRSIEVDSKDWNRLENNILKIYEKREDKLNAWLEYYGYAGYMLENDRIIGIHQIGTNTPLEKLIPNPPIGLKFGIGVPDAIWQEVQRRNFV